MQQLSQLRVASACPRPRGIKIIMRRNSEPEGWSPLTESLSHIHCLTFNAPSST